MPCPIGGGRLLSVESKMASQSVEIISHTFLNDSSSADIKYE